MTSFAQESVSEALERSLRNAKHLRARDAAAAAAARALAWKIDNWETLAEAAIMEATENGGKPKVPQNDNVSLASFLKYMDALGLTPTTVVLKAEAPASDEAEKPSKRKKTDFERYKEQFG